MGTKPTAEDIPEITPEMIEAGAAVLWNAETPDPLWLSPTLAADLAEKVLRQALSARRS